MSTQSIFFESGSTLALLYSKREDLSLQFSRAISAFELLPSASDFSFLWCDPPWESSSSGRRLRIDFQCHAIPTSPEFEHVDRFDATCDLTGTFEDIWVCEWSVGRPIEAWGYVDDSVRSHANDSIYRILFSTAAQLHRDWLRECHSKTIVRCDWRVCDVHIADFTFSVCHRSRSIFVCFYASRRLLLGPRCRPERGEDRFGNVARRLLNRMAVHFVQARRDRAVGRRDSFGNGIYRLHPRAQLNVDDPWDVTGQHFEMVLYKPEVVFRRAA